MVLRFRNLDVSPADPVSEWGVEGIATALDRGGARDWAKIIEAVDAAPYGPTAHALEEALLIAESGGSVALMRHVLADARATPEERAVKRLLRASRETELPRKEIAERLGTSRTRLSSYLSGAVSPSAVVVTRLDDLAAKRRNELV